MRTAETRVSGWKPKDGTGIVPLRSAEQDEGKLGRQ